MDVYIVPGLVIGSVWAITGAGLVLTYSTSGVLNLAYGGIAFSIAETFYYLRVSIGMEGWIALAICVLGISPLLGIALWFGMFRRLVGTGLVPPLIASIGLAIGLPALATTLFQPGQVFIAPGIADNGPSIKRFIGMGVTVNQIYAIAAAVTIALALFFLLRLTTLGLLLRAVFDNRAVAALAGASPGRMSTVSWALGAALAGLSGILLAPVLQLSSGVFIELTVASLAAALVGGLVSVPVTFASAIGLGLLSSILAGVNTGEGLLAVGIRPALPFIVMMIVLMVKRRAISLGVMHRPASTTRVRKGMARRRIMVGAFLVVLIIVPTMVSSAYWTGVLAVGLVYSLIFLGFTVCIGDAGLLPLGQGAMVGIGGFVSGQIAVHAGSPLLVAIVLGGLLAAGVGAILAFVGARMGPLEFGLATLAFGLFADDFLYQWHTLVPIGGVTFGAASLFGLSLSSPTTQYYVFAGFLLVGLAMVRYYRSTATAFVANATRMNPVVVEASGLSARSAQVLAFALGGLLAGVGGGLLGLFQQHLAGADVSTYVGLVWLAVVVTMGVRSPVAAVVGGLAYALLPAVLSKWLPPRFGQLPAMLFGLGGLALATNPDGIISLVTAMLPGRRVGNRAALPTGTNA